MEVTTFNGQSYKTLTHFGRNYSVKPKYDTADLPVLYALAQYSILPNSNYYIVSSTSNIIYRHIQLRWERIKTSEESATRNVIS